MQCAVITLFPDMLKAVIDHGVTSRAIQQGLLAVECWNPRDYTLDNHRTVDDRPYGGGPGMVLMMQPLLAAIQAAKQALPDPVKVLHLTPQGRVLDQSAVTELSSYGNLVLVCGRYEGIDERVIESAVDEEWSIGDYVISGGELAAMILIDAMARTLPGCLGNKESAQRDSFYNGLLDYPHYTRPENYAGQAVPDVLLSGNHERIRQWRIKQALGRTWLRRPDLLEKLQLTDEQQQLLDEYKSEYNAAR